MIPTPGREVMVVRHSECPVPRLAAAIFLSVSAFVAGAGVSRADPSSSCQSVTAPMVDIPGGDSEPRLRIPLPSGWEVSPTLSPTDPSIRAAILNPALSDSGFTPNAVVTLKKVGSSSGDASRILELQNEILQTKAGVTDLSAAPTRVCGLPAMTSTYTAPVMGSAPARNATSLVVVDDSGDAIHIASVTIQSANPTDDTYSRDARTILDGFQVISAA